MRETVVSSTQARVISKDMLEQRLTADDLIGAEVVGSDNETLGEIVDVTLVDTSGIAPQEDSSTDSVEGGVAPEYGQESYRPNATSSTGDVAASAESNRSPAEVDDFNAGSNRASSSKEAYRRMKPTPSSSGSEIAVVIETGGGLLKESTLVEVPIDSLSRNAEGKLTLNLSLDQINALAVRRDGTPADLDSAS